MKLVITLTLGLFCLVLGSRAISAQDAAVTIDGKWHFVLDTPGGDREIDSEFAVDKDGNVTGKWGTAAVTGTFADGKLSLTFNITAEETGETGPIKITGKLDQGDLTGNWEFSSYSGTFKASRPKSA
jgi:hypothetical protein